MEQSSWQRKPRSHMDSSLWFGLSWNCDTRPWRNGVQFTESSLYINSNRIVAHSCSISLWKNWICAQDANAVYCIAIANLIGQPGNAKAAIEKAESWATENAHPTIQDWLKEALSNNPLIKMDPGTDGWVRWGLTLAFRFANFFQAMILQHLCTALNGV